jgi:acyl-CoA thioester hydrolase
LGRQAIEQRAQRPTGLPGFAIRVYYQDTDAGGIVYHARYLDFMERARTEWLRALGVDLPLMIAEHRCMFVAASVTIDYLKSARLDDMLTVRADPEKIARTYIDLNQDIFCGSIQLTRGRIRIACVHTANQRPAAMPREVASKIAARIHNSGPSA